MAPEPARATPNGRFGKGFLLLLVAGITILFLAMIRSFLLSILLAGIFAAMAQPLYGRLLALLRGRRTTAAVLTLIILLVAIILPLLGILGVVTAQAFRISETVGPWIEKRIAEPDVFARTLENLPGYHLLAPYRDEIMARAAQAVGRIGAFLVESLSAATRGTITFFFQLFLMLYAMFFFLMEGGPLLRRILSYVPLKDEDEQRMVERFVSVARATLKGTLLIGLVQGSLAGMAFWVAGIESPLFWGTLMVLLSIIPGIGTALVWVPASVILMMTDRVAAGLGLALFCGLVVSSVDNLLRPRLVGRDTQMHDLLVLFGTLGGLLLFGVLGFIVGPIVAALFVTIWEIYGSVFRDQLSGPGSLTSRE
jgi:predicted PurR-regulated permease PerM